MTDDLERNDDDFEKVLRMTLDEGYEATMKYIEDMEQGNEETCEPDHDGSLEEQLYDAIVRIDVTRAKVLMADGADCNALWRDGEPLLFHAIVMGDLPLVKACLAFGGDILALDTWGGFSAAHAATMSRQWEMLVFVLEAMIAAGARKEELLKECLWMAVCDHNYSFVEGLLMLGVSPDTDGWNGKKFYPPLLQAARLRDKKMVELLLNYGATVAADSFMVKSVLEKRA
jgi:ankyrin repeat protein